ncbi:MAG: sulfatase [Deltaproteobacteria bacterium]|nr:sulfatase [Deltaproteobacteria bacterium]
MRRLLLLGMLALVACNPVDPQAPVPVAARPGMNVLVVSFDALRADSLGVHGAPREASPRIDEFAGRAVVFDAARASSPVTPTSFAAMFTGRTPLETFRDWRLEPGDTLPGLLAGAGYATAAFVHNAQLVAERGFDRGFDLYSVEGSEHGQLDAAVAAAALRWMSEVDEPFLAWLHLLDPHSPWERRQVSSGFYDPAYRGRFGETGPGPILAMHEPAELERLRTLYAGEVHAADLLFGQLLDSLEKHGLLARTILVLTSDHGEGLMDHGMLQHGQLFDEDLRIPLIVRHPDLEAGSRVALPVGQEDLLPTLASMVGVALPPGSAGRDLRKRTAPRDQVAVAYTGTSFRQASLMTPAGHKLIVECGERIQRGFPRVQLFDLVADPGEQVDLAARRPEEVADLEARLWQRLGLGGCAELRMQRGASGRSAQGGLAPDTVRQLEALGYGAGAEEAHAP